MVLSGLELGNVTYEGEGSGKNSRTGHHELTINENRATLKVNDVEVLSDLEVFYFNGYLFTGESALYVVSSDSQTLTACSSSSDLTTLHKVNN